MAWPQIEDFRNAILVPTNLKDKDLGSGEVVKNKLGLPMPWAGGIVIAYKVVTKAGAWAVRTFKAETDHLVTYNMISSFMNTLPMWSRARAYFAKFEYVQHGIDVPPYRSDPLNPYPVVKMEWVDGLRLDQWVRSNLGTSDRLSAAAGKWVEMIAKLFNEGLAHGDLQQGNVLVTDSGHLKLIDYDGMYVPAMQKQRARELGHPNWNHPGRSDAAFGDFLDQFTGLVGYISLNALASAPELFQKYNNGDNVIFKSSDFRDPASSPIFSDLRRITRTRDGGLSVAEMADNLAAWSQAAVDSMTLDEAISKKKATVGVGTVYVGARVEIIVVTEPAGAMVKIDGTAYGQTDDKDGRLRVSVSPTISKFDITSPGYESLSERVDLKKARDGDTHRFALKKVMAADVLVIKTKPLGAEVKIEDDFYGLTIPGGISIPKAGLPGQVHIEVNRPGYRSIDERVRIEKVDELDFVLEPHRSARSLAAWFLSGLFGSLLTLMVFFQVILLAGHGLEILRTYWGAFAFCSGAVGLLIYALVQRHEIKGSLILLFTSSVALVLGSPEILLRAAGWDVLTFLKAPLALIGQLSFGGDSAPELDKWSSAYLLKMFAFRYLGFAGGIVLGWKLGSKFDTRIQPFPGILICVAGGCLLPAALLFRVAGVDATTQVQGLGPAAGTLILWVIPGVLLGLFSGCVLRLLQVLGQIAARRAWVWAPLVGALYCYFISCAFMFYFMGAKPVAMTLTTVPGGVKVFLNSLDNPVGETDESGRLTIPVEPGELVLMLRKQGFKPRSVEYDVQSVKRASLPAVELTRVECNLRIKTDPGNVSVYVQGTLLGKTDSSGSLLLRDVNVERPLDITFRRDGYKEAAVRFARCCPEQECSVARLSLTKLGGKLRLKTNAPSAQVLVTDRQSRELLRVKTDASGTVLLSDLPLNQVLKVLVKKDGFEEKAVKVNFSPQDLDQERSVQVRPLAASVILKTVPARVRVYIGTRFAGESGEDNLLVVRDIPAGKSQTIRLQKDGFEEKSLQLKVPPSYRGKVFDYGEVRLSKVRRPRVSGTRRKERSTAGSTRSRRDGSDRIAKLRAKALQGHASSQNNYGVALLRGKGVPRDETEAVKWFRKAADQGNAVGQYNLGQMYRQGKGVTRDDKQAVMWYRRAAKQKYVDAYYQLGRMYEFGTGVTRDYEEAMKWYRRAAEKGSDKAQNSLGLMYERGTGVPKDYVEAARYYFRSADQDNRVAQYNLGLAYLYGRGVAKDRDEAVNWFRRSAQNGYEPARKRLREMGVSDR